MSRYQPTEEQIKQVMNETGMDSLQARRHMEQRLWLQSGSPNRRSGDRRRNDDMPFLTVQGRHEYMMTQVDNERAAANDSTFD